MSTTTELQQQLKDAEAQVAAVREQLGESSVLPIRTGSIIVPDGILFNPRPDKYARPSPCQDTMLLAVNLKTREAAILGRVKGLEECRYDGWEQDSIEIELPSRSNKDYLFTPRKRMALGEVGNIFRTLF